MLCHRWPHHVIDYHRFTKTIVGFFTQQETNVVSDSTVLHTSRIRARQVHSHLKLECWALVLPLGAHFNVSITFLQNLLAYIEAHAETIRVELLLGALNHTEHMEQFLQLVLLDALSCVDDVDVQALLWVIVSCPDRNAAIVRELQGVFRQIDQNLLQSYLISFEKLRQMFEAVFKTLMSVKNFAWVRHWFYCQPRFLLLGLDLKDILDEKEGLRWWECYAMDRKSAQFKHFQVKNVVDEA